MGCKGMAETSAPVNVDDPLTSGYRFAGIQLSCTQGGAWILEAYPLLGQVT